MLLLCKKTICYVVSIKKNMPQSFLCALLVVMCNPQTVKTLTTHMAMTGLWQNLEPPKFFAQTQDSEFHSEL